MFKKIFAVALLALAFAAASGTSSAHDPYPECHPCPFVR
jgi:hypothetical protein